MGKSKREKRDSEATEEAPRSKKIKTEESQDLTQDLTQEVTQDETQSTQLTHEEKIAFCSIIAKPMASRKLTKKLLKLIRKASKISRKTLLRVGLKDVQLRIRKGSFLSIEY